MQREYFDNDVLLPNGEEVEKRSINWRIDACIEAFPNGRFDSDALKNFWRMLHTHCTALLGYELTGQVHARR